MRLIAAVPGSVLWLLEGAECAKRNLLSEATERGIGPERLVFAPLLPRDEHLARLAAADLFLDTLPVNAHTSASDALRAGVPVLTCPGQAFVGRVAASLLHAVGLPELVTASLAGYEQLALELVSSPERLRALCSRLARNIETHPLFDTDRFRCHLESAYLLMMERHLRGESPASFAVAAMSDSRPGRTPK
jgi:predicted O-linked N-acetylglucosamine transferase (SPINDLY family)